MTDSGLSPKALQQITAILSDMGVSEHSEECECEEPTIQCLYCGLEDVEDDDVFNCPFCDFPRYPDAEPEEVCRECTLEGKSICTYDGYCERP